MRHGRRTAGSEARERVRARTYRGGCAVRSRCDHGAITVRSRGNHEAITRQSRGSLAGSTHTSPAPALRRHRTRQGHCWRRLLGDRTPRQDAPERHVSAPRVSALARHVFANDGQYPCACPCAFVCVHMPFVRRAQRVFAPDALAHAARRARCASRRAKLRGSARLGKAHRLRKWRRSLRASAATNIAAVAAAAAAALVGGAPQLTRAATVAGRCRRG